MSVPAAQVAQRTPNSFTDDYKKLVFIVEQLLGKLITIVPVRVMAVTNSGSLNSDPYVNVQPLLNQMTGAQQPIEHGQIFNVPVWRMQGGSSAIILDPAVGDVGLALVAYRDGSSLVAADQASPGSLQGGSTTFNPGSRAQYDWGSAFYLGGWFGGAISQYIQLTDTLCKIVAPTINLNGLTIDSSGNLATSGTVVANGINLHDHVHTGVQSGASNTGPATG